MTERLQNHVSQLARSEHNPDWNLPEQSADDFLKSHPLPDESPTPETEPNLSGLVRLPGRLKQALQASATPFQTWSLRTKVTALVTAISVTPILGVGGIAYFLADHAIAEQVGKAKTTEAAQFSDKLTRFMLERLANVETFAAVSKLVADTQGESASIEALPIEARQALAEKFTEGMQNYFVYDSIALYSLDGNLLVQAQGSAPERNQKDQAYFQRVLETGRAAISEPTEFSSAVTAPFAVYIAVPVRDQDGEVVAIVTARMPVQNIGTAVFRSNSLQEDVTYRLVDSRGRIFQSLQDEAQTPIGTVMAEAMPLFAQVEEQKVDQAWFSTRNAQLSQLNAYSSMGTVGELNWSVVTSTPLEAAFAPQRQLLITIALGTGLTALAVAALAAFLARQLTRPILAAADTVQQIGQGDLRARLPLQGQDELATLGANINQMANQLETLIGQQMLSIEQAKALAAVTSTSTQTPEEIELLFNQTLDAARELLAVDRVLFYQFDENWVGTIVAESVGAEWPQTLGAQIHDPCFATDYVEKYQQGRVQATPNIYEAGLTSCHLSQLEPFAVKANLVTPVRQGGRLLGLLIAHHCAGPYDWPEPEIVFLQQMANQLGVVLDRLYYNEQIQQAERDQRQAKELIQRRALELMLEVDPISQGDLTVRAKVTPDEIGTIADSYNAIVDNLRKIVVQVQAAADQVDETTQSNESAVQNLSLEALQQAEEIAIALQQIEGLTETVQRVATNAEQATVAVQRAAQTVESGDQVMNRTVDGIQAAQATVAETARKVEYLGEVSQKISTIVDLISGFAAQTNMLALNASIEASRAGEEGRGFAIVANEVRALAQNSAQATSEVKRLVASIQAATEEVITAMETGTEQVATGAKLVDETRQSLNQITAASAEIRQLVEAIAETTVMQTQSSETVAQTMTHVAIIANHTSQEAIQVFDSFKELRAIAQALQSEVDRFKISV